LVGGKRGRAEGGGPGGAQKNSAHNGGGACPGPCRGGGGGDRGAWVGCFQQKKKKGGGTTHNCPGGGVVFPTAGGRRGNGKKPKKNKTTRPQIGAWMGAQKPWGREGGGGTKGGFSKKISGGGGFFGFPTGSFSKRLVGKKSLKKLPGTKPKFLLGPGLSVETKIVGGPYKGGGVGDGGPRLLTGQKEKKNRGATAR